MDEKTRAELELRMPFDIDCLIIITTCWKLELELDEDWEELTYDWNCDSQLSTCDDDNEEHWLWLSETIELSWSELNIELLELLKLELIWFAIDWMERIDSKTIFLIDSELEELFNDLMDWTHKSYIDFKNDLIF